MLQNIVNVEEARSWDGDEGDHWTDHEEAYNNATGRHYRRLAEALDIGTADRVLDIGCGTGLSTRDVARAASSGSALGIDLSARMLERARQRAEEEGLINVTFVQGDAQVHAFEAQAFDVVMSRFGAMFFADPVAGYRNLAAAAKPAARLAQLTWQGVENNPWLQELREALSLGRPLPGETLDAPGPFGLATEGHIRRVLGEGGWTDISVERVHEPMYFGRTADEGFELLRDMGLARGLAKALNFSDRERQQAIERLHDTLRKHETAEGVLMEANAWLITARRA